jgi:DNA-binding MarR family transcriptional regulator
MSTDKQGLTNNILQVTEEIFKLIGLVVPDEWLSSDLTVTQLRILLLLQTLGPMRMSDIASSLSVTLPTTTSIVDNLVRKNLVIRETNPSDRRVVICRLSPEGQKLIGSLWTSSQLAMKKLLEGLSPEQLQKASEVAEFLRESARNFHQQKK